MPPDPSLGRNEFNFRATPELAWDAFRYVCDLMGPPEVDDFEARLFQDQATREAVAEAVDSLGAIGIVAREVRLPLPTRLGFVSDQPTSTSPHPGPPGLTSMAMAMAMAAAVLLAVLPAVLGTLLRPSSIGNAIDVALAWTNLREGHVGEATRHPASRRI